MIYFYNVDRSYRKHSQNSRRYFGLNLHRRETLEGLQISSQQSARAGRYINRRYQHVKEARGEKVVVSVYCRHTI